MGASSSAPVQGTVLNEWQLGLILFVVLGIVLVVMNHYLQNNVYYNNITIGLAALILFLCAVAAVAGFAFLLLPIVLIYALVWLGGWGVPVASALILALVSSATVGSITYALTKDIETQKYFATATGILNGIMIPVPGIIVLLAANHQETYNYAFFMIHFSMILSIISLSSNVIVKLNS